MHVRTLATAVAPALSVAAPARAQLVPIGNGEIVQDGQINWLANANLASDAAIRATLGGLYGNLPTCSAALSAGCVNPTPTC
jgi:hypothetical protein